MFLNRQSLTFRLVLLSSLVAFFALVAVIVALSATYKQSEERAFRELLNAHMLSLIAAIDVEPSGKIASIRPLAFPGFSRPLSGWYWQVQEAKISAEKRVLYGSPSLVGEQLIAGAANSDLPRFDDNFERFYSIGTSLEGMTLQVFESQILLGEGDDPANLLIAGPANLVLKRVRSFTLWLVLYLGGFALVLILSNVIIVRLGLRPLQLLTQQLDLIRAGQQTNLLGTVPTEVEPLVDATNSLIENNKQIVERARSQVGNLAHALKTPIAVLQNESRANEHVDSELLQNQTRAMQDSVQRYLDRARIAAQKGGVANSVEITPVIERLVRVMGKLNPNVEFVFDGEQLELIFAGEVQDFEEMLGNLLENAGRFAKSQVLISAGFGDEQRIVVTVDDDGDGLSDDQMAMAVKRGKRLDESKPGSGLGLSIVNEIAREYEGDFKLAKSAIGGLRAELVLPSVASSLLS